MTLNHATELSFAALAELPEQPGVYEVWTRTGIALKVGIAANLRRRLKSHAASRQSGLKIKPGGKRTRPDDVLSKSSILAKHLYYDRAITREFDLATEKGRRAFLEQRCVLRYHATASRAAAREVEAVLEASCGYRYFGRVVWRRTR